MSNQLDAVDANFTLEKIDSQVRESRLQYWTRITKYFYYLFFASSWLVFCLPTILIPLAIPISFCLLILGCVCWTVNTYLNLSSVQLITPKKEVEFLKLENVAAVISVVACAIVAVSLFMPGAGTLVSLAGLLLFVLSNGILLKIENDRTNALPRDNKSELAQLQKNEFVAYRNAMIFLTCVSIFMVLAVALAIVLPASTPCFFGLIILHAYELKALAIIALRAGALFCLTQNFYYKHQKLNIKLSKDNLEMPLKGECTEPSLALSQR